LPLEQISASGTPLYYHQDQLGSTRAMTNGSGNVVATYLYDAYGNVISSTGTVSNPLQFAGAYSDAESGLLYLRARYYDPASGSFLTEDPLSALQPYAYAGDSPLNLVDPSGLAPNLVGWFEDTIQSAPQRVFGLANNIYFGPEQALNNGDCLGAGIALVGLFFGPVGPEFRGAEAAFVSEDGGFLRFMGREKPPLQGTSGSIYTQVNKEGRAVQNAIYDENGNVIGHVDFKNTGPGAASGHGHMFPPGQPGLGHGPGAPHIPYDELPPGWGDLPPGVSPHTPIGE